MTLQASIPNADLFAWLMQHHFSEIAWRKAPVPQKPATPPISPVVQTAAATLINKNKLTGGPAHRELKSIIIDILASQQLKTQQPQ